MKKRIYIDTSVIGGCFDDEFKEDSMKLMKELEKGSITLVISDVLLFELEAAPNHVKNILNTLPENSVEYVPLTEQAINLANHYIKEGAVAERSLSDARHVAIATIERVNVLISWNFKHLVNIDRINLLNSVNIKFGYPILEIRSPKEVIF
jgi:predicted nucleic acid-binding protein